MIEDEVSQGNWSPFKVAPGFTLSHVMFVDDIILIAKADVQNAQTIMRILNSFVDQ